MIIWSSHGRGTVSLLHSQSVLVLTLVLLLCPVGRVAGQSQTQSPAQVLQDLLSRYGDNSTISVPQLRSLLAVLSQGESQDKDGGSSTPETTTSTPPKSNSSKILLESRDGKLNFTGVGDVSLTTSFFWPQQTRRFNPIFI